MATTSMPGSPVEKRSLPGRVLTAFLRLLRLFWPTELILALVTAYGMYHGWSGSRQWSDAFFYAAVAQLMISAVVLVGATGEISASEYVRYVSKGDISDTWSKLVQIEQSKQGFAIRVFIGCVLTAILALIVAR